jgi:hypothetical protein
VQNIFNEFLGEQERVTKRIERIDRKEGRDDENDSQYGDKL